MQSLAERRSPDVDVHDHALGSSGYARVAVGGGDGDHFVLEEEHLGIFFVGVVAADVGFDYAGVVGAEDCEEAVYACFGEGFEEDVGDGVGIFGAGHRGDR